MCAEKLKRLAEGQSLYKGTLEKMIRDAMHQSVIYKEHARLNQVVSNSLMARLEAQKAIRDNTVGWTKHNRLMGAQYQNDTI
nr:hypothetical protein [Tanacetum cinerariifolium]